MSDSKETSENPKTSAPRESSSISLGSTFDVFENRLQRKLQKKESNDSAAQEATDARHTRMLKAMNTIRKALQDTSRIRLGSRFSFQLDVVDFEGWPKINLTLIDNVAPDRKDFGLVISANDRQGLGTINIVSLPNTVLGRVQLKDPAEMERLPLLLKKSVRDFLDVVADYVLNPKKPEELIDVQARNLDEDEPDSIDTKLSGVELFSDELDIADDNRVESVSESGIQQKDLQDEGLQEKDRLDSENVLEPEDEIFESLALDLG